ncbi:hypothetical protein ACXR0O_09245 [Verrucomicrobiota bacterium sgz303538]
MIRRYVSFLAIGLGTAWVCASTAVADQVPDDEAKVQGLTPQHFAPWPHDYFPGMDWLSEPAQSTNTGASQNLPDQLLDKGQRPARLVGPAKLNPSEIMGRNTWMLWCGGNERFWDWLGSNGYGFTDLLKVIDSRTRPTRFRDAGLINEPNMRQASASETGGRYGLWIDVPVQRPEFKTEEERKQYEHFVEVYGESTGVVGLRLFKNPAFEAAKDRWDAKRYYEDASYYNDPKLVRPYRVGMSCAFCHASFHPLNPPVDVAEPAWDNISGNIGAQYLRIRAVFGNMLAKDNFVYHVLDSQPPGTIDTSLIASDNINNPNTMNSIFGVPQRVGRSFANPKEKLSGDSADFPSVWRDPNQAPEAFKQAIPELVDSNVNPRRVPRILLDGADSVGVWGALARVYLNIGTFSEQWNRLHNPLVGFEPQKPFRIKDCAEHSVYWQATQLRVEPLRDYFLRITPTMPLTDAKGGSEKAKKIDISKLAHGRKVFANNCIVCHSSVQPKERQEELEKWAALGEPWDHDPGRWLRNDAYIKWAEQAVETPEFWQNNYLSTDYRVPITLVGTNSARAVATNGLTGHMWADFASESFRTMRSIGSIQFFNPFLGKDGGSDSYTPRHKVAPGVPEGGGGPGFYRVPTLMSIWSTAPLLHNNSLGHFTNDPSVDGRMEAFDDAIRKLLWPERRLANSDYAASEQLKKDHGLIWRTPEVTYLNIPAAYVPSIATRLPVLMKVKRWIPFADAFSGAPWLPSAILFGLAFVSLVVVDPSAVARRIKGTQPVDQAELFSKRLFRIVGYSSVLAALLVGFLLYFLNGRLGDLKIGPIPKGTPVNLLANINPDADPAELQHAFKVTLNTLAEIESKRLSEAEAQNLMRERVAPVLMKVSRCPDFVMDKGHYYEWFNAMSDADKEALIELIKTF